MRKNLECAIIEKMEKCAQIYEILLNNNPNASCELNYKSPFELLVAVILSAQCTDKRVNIVAQKLFERANTAAKIAEMDIIELKNYIHACGFYSVKSKNIKAMATKLVDSYGGELPNTFEELIKLDGVGHKTANVIMAEIFKVPSIAVDTHVFRVSHRLGLSDANTPDGVEQDLKRQFPREQWIKLHHLFIHLGRYICKSQNPSCENCPLKKENLCKFQKG